MQLASYIPVTSIESLLLINTQVWVLCNTNDDTTLILWDQTNSYFGILSY